MRASTWLPTAPTLPHTRPPRSHLRSPIILCQMDRTLCTLQRETGDSYLLDVMKTPTILHRLNNYMTVFHNTYHISCHVHLIFYGCFISSEHCVSTGQLAPMCQFSICLWVEWVNVHCVIILGSSWILFIIIEQDSLSGSRPSPRSPVTIISRLTPKALPSRAPSE